MLVTDINPVLAARAVPLELIEPIAIAIKEGYEKAQKCDYKRISVISPLSELIYADLTYSRKNCEFYHDFYNELVDITKVAGIFELPKLTISALKIKASSMFMINPLNIHSPMLDEYYQELIEANQDKYNKAPDIYMLSRLMLLDLNPKFEDFIKGIPVWYVNTSNTILDAYDSTNRRHIKIIDNKGRYRYLTSIISDRWTEIENVPPEMDLIVQYLISNRANLAFTNEG